MPQEQHEDPFEGRLGNALRRVGGTFETDHQALAGGGAVRGRRLLFRRRAAMLGGVAGIALVGVGGALLLPGTGDGGRSVAAKRSIVPDAEQVVRDDDGAVSGAELVRMLKEMLPEGSISGESARGTSADGGPYAQVVYDDGGGGGAVQLGVGRIDADSEYARQLTDCPDKRFVGYVSCEEKTLPGGARLMLFRGYEYPDRRVDTKHWYAQLVDPAGYEVSVMEWNATAQKDAPVTRAEPPLSLDSLTTIVRDPGWQAVADAITEESENGGGTREDQGEKEESSTVPPGGGSVDAPVVGGEAIRRTLVSLLPEGVDVVTEDSQVSDFAYVVLDDGEGRSLVQINVQPGMADLADSLFGADAETLPDGTKVATRQEPGEKGGEGVVMWTADTLRVDGLRVVISAFNSGAQHTAATRETPALTMAQLREIATSERWKSLD
ncbi:hypothetical protein RM704_02860 [Streptomyces sp. DSM 3412]|uniref:Uncharacterized protein n=1 Tax=Streptomyces gottesmaniae TaxID=3075518 RepID=A0ABU2YQ19_9ACTN|nr:hypothetical protein [Streptomyces sp. DSM 3412]MDT0566427.1 hypothetical protein [Streptomyces sp. DSM 3412]